MNLQAISGQYTIVSLDLFLDQDLPTKSKHIFYGRDSKVVLYSLHHLGSVHSSLVLGLLAAAHITAFSLAGKPMFVLDGTQDRELCVQALIIGIRFINLSCQKIKHRFQFRKAAISSTPIFLLQEICTNFLWINGGQSTFNSNMISQTF